MKPISGCRACKSTKLVEFLDLGKQYISDFREDRDKPSKYPLVAVFCNNCKLVQLKHSTPQAEMYHQNYGFKSGISDSIKKDLNEIVTDGFQYKNDPKSWLDIASNDGTLLSFVPKDVYRVGIDPVGFLCEEAKQHADLIVNDYYNSDVFQYYGDDGHMEYQKFDVITSVSCFYDMPDPSKFVREVANVLADDGIWIIQQNYLLSTLQFYAVDNFCHEHLEYYTLLSLENLLERFGLEVNEVLVTTVNGGSIRTIVSRKGSFPITKSVELQRKEEFDYELSIIDPYVDFANKVGDNLNKLYKLVNNLKANGKTIAILAASTRGATIWQAANITPELVDYAVERNPAKVGKWFSAIDIPIISEAEAHRRKPDYMIIGPWFFAEEIIDRESEYLETGGHLITPLPEVKII